MISKVAIATHVLATGPAQDLRDYLNNNKTDEVLFIGHPLIYSDYVQGSGYSLFKKGDHQASYYAPNLNIPFLASYFLSFWLSLYWGLRFIRNYDLYVGSNNLNALVGVILKKLGLVKKTIYYVIDYNPKRFDNDFINSLYHKLDQLCVLYSDETWNLSSRMAQGRKDAFNFEGGNQILSPIGVWYERLPRKDIHSIEKHTAIFHGHVNEKQGVQHVIKALPNILNVFPDFKLIVIGDGPYKATLESLAKDLFVSSSVRFTGYIDDHKDLEKELCNCALAFALYEKYDPNGNLSFTYYADPGKLKLYLACGLPILLTDVSHNAQEIQDKHCGLIVDTNPESIANAVVDLLDSSDKLSIYRDNAKEYSQQFNWENIFKELINA